VRRSPGLENPSRSDTFLRDAARGALPASIGWFIWCEAVVSIFSNRATITQRRQPAACRIVRYNSRCRAPHRLQSESHRRPWTVSTVFCVWYRKLSESTPHRTAEIARSTRETEIRLTLDLDGQGRSEVATGIGFLDHMLELFARHSLVDLTVACKGDLHVDGHHTTEDVGICLGQAIDRALADRAGIRRYGHAVLPMDESLVTTAVDLGGRAYWVWNVAMPSATIGTFDSELVADFWQAVAASGRMNLHVTLHYGRNTHHVSEAVFKAAARALRDAFELDPRCTGVPSTKGTL
jgi:imidazoleglycerol-phosphate dehydratase